MRTIRDADALAICRRRLRFRPVASMASIEQINRPIAWTLLSYGKRRYLTGRPSSGPLRRVWQFVSRTRLSATFNEHEEDDSGERPESKAQLT
jgi:hypothetical protein